MCISSCTYFNTFYQEKEEEEEEEETAANTYEAGGVIITCGLGVTKSLQDGIGLDNLVLQVLRRERKRERDF